MPKNLSGSITAAISMALALRFVACTSSAIDPESEPGQNGFPCSPYVDYIATYTQGGNPNDDGTARFVLGPPDTTGVSIRQDSVLTTVFTGLGAVMDTAGNDLRVYSEFTSDGRIAVYAGYQADDIPYCGELSPENDEIDLRFGSVSAAIYVQLVGLSGEANVDAIESLGTRCP